MGPIIVIEDPEDPRVAPYRDLREPDAVARRHGFIAEGAVVLARAMASPRATLGSVLLAERKLAALTDLLAGLAPDVPVYVAAQPVLDRICGFPVHRGVLGAGPAPVAPDPAGLLGGLGRRAVVVCLVGIGDGDNMGSIFRNATALGADAVLLDATCCDPLYRRAVRVSVGAALVTPYARLAPGEDPVTLLDRCGFDVLAFSPHGALELDEVRPAPRTALLFGAEGPGLPAGLLARTRTVRIAMADGFDSLNVATTSGIALHHLRAQAERLRQPS